MLDFQDIKNRVSYTDVVSFLALNGKRVGEQFRAKCPACTTDNDRSLVLTSPQGREATFFGSSHTCAASASDKRHKRSLTTST